MFAIRSRKFQLGLMFATALSASMLPGASQAYTPEEEQACSGDAFRLCGPEIPDVDRVTACMIRNKSQLTPGCRVYFREPEGGPAVTPVASGRPLSLGPASSRKPASAKPRKPKKPAKRDAN
jgi:hypothetical protein